MALDSFAPKSSFLEKAEYDGTQRQLTIYFKSGTQTKYFYVFPAIWLSFKQSPDHSSYYSRAIKGKLMSVPIIKHTIGHKQKTALNQPKKERTLHDGNIFPHTHTGSISSRKRKRSPGNIPDGFR